MAIAQNLGTTITALLPVLYTIVAPPGSSSVPLVIGSITFGVTIIAAIAAWTALETYRTPLKDLGDPGAVPMERREYERLRAEAAADVIS
jgi:hypothetical protein